MCQVDGESQKCHISRKIELQTASGGQKNAENQKILQLEPNLQKWIFFKNFFLDLFQIQPSWSGLKFKLSSSRILELSQIEHL